jgi:hypothetical protein
MKITMDVDITPEEVRKLFGLPDVEAFQRQLMEDLRGRMQAGAEGYDPLALFQPYVTGGMAGWDMFQRLIAGASRPAATSGKGDDK